MEGEWALVESPKDNGKHERESSRTSIIAGGNLQSGHASLIANGELQDNQCGGIKFGRCNFLHAFGVVGRSRKTDVFVPLSKLAGLGREVATLNVVSGGGW
ncbi:hypothetical protein VNO78_07318 [Psophocarpus tetragonolobus]|uniref:Uncharacterized protein n=1 Tax=Psophocarpus tetragonolobus TaxID=3891 RepID=A0AAN9SW04_PSOTE